VAPGASVGYVQTISNGASNSKEKENASKLENPE
jgi:hypothetical protein